MLTLRLGFAGFLLLVGASSLSARGAWAESVERFKIDRDQQDGLVLKGPACKEVEAQLRALRSWKENLGETPGSYPAPVSTGSGCKVRLGGSVPAFLEQLEGGGAVHDGPNCWNSTLLGPRMAELPRYGTPEEFASWMGSPFCRALPPAEDLLPGDIVVIRSLERSYAEEKIFEHHAFVHLSEELAFSKNGFQGIIPYRIQNAEKIYKTYGLGPDARGCRHVLAETGRKSCPRWSEAYRCSSPERGKRAFDDDGRWNWALEELRRLEVRVNSWVFGAEFSSDELAATKARLDYLQNRFVAWFEEMRVQPNLSRREELDLTLLDVTIYRIASLKRQTGILYSSL